MSHDMEILKFHVKSKKSCQFLLKINFGTVFTVLIPNGIKPVIFNLKKYLTYVLHKNKSFRQING